MHLPPTTIMTGNSSDPLFALIHSFDMPTVDATISIEPSATSSSFGWSDFPIVNECNAEYTVDDATTTTTATTTAFSLPVSATSTSTTGCSNDQKATTTTRHKKNVSFSSVIEIRSHDIILSDHPCCRGLPLGLGWDYRETEIVDFDLYENEQSLKRQRGELRLSYWERVHLLQKITGLSEQQLIEQEQEYLLEELRRSYSSHTTGNHPRSFIQHGFPSSRSLSTLVCDI